jgi:hypothetical protein
MKQYRCETCDSLEPCTCFCDGCGLPPDECVCGFKPEDFEDTKEKRRMRKTMENKLKELKEEYETQDNCATAYPIFVTVQEKHCIGVLEENHSTVCPYGDGDTEIKYTHEDLEHDYDTEEDCFKELQNAIGPHEAEYEKDNIIEQNLGYIWVDREWFLTLKAAKQFMKNNSHHLGTSRTYTHHFNRRNFEMRELLENINFKVK